MNVVAAEQCEDVIAVTSDFRDKDLIRTVPGASWDGDTRTWKVPLSWASCLTLRGIFGERLEIGPALCQWGWDHRKNVIEPALVLRAATDAPSIDDRLYPFQNVGVQFLSMHEWALLLDDMGPQPVNTPVLTPSGWTQLGMLVPGDEVYDSQGQAARVDGIKFFGERPIYRVTLSDRTSTLATADHRWQVYTPSDRHRGTNGRKLTTQNLMESGLFSTNSKGRLSKFYLPQQPIVDDLGDGGELPLDPYAYGALLGDGYLGGLALSLTCPDDSIRAAVAQAAQDLGTSSRDSVRIDHCAVVVFHSKGKLRSVLDELGALTKSANKYVNDRYRLAPVAVRRAVLAGLLDTDGTVSSPGNNVEFSSASPKLAADVAWLSRSLGAVVTESEPQNAGYRDEQKTWHECLPKHRVLIRFPADGEVPFRVCRKAARWEQGAVRVQRRQPPRTISRIEPAGTASVCCISINRDVEHERVFLTDTALIPTSNTGKSVEIIKTIENRRGLGKNPFPALIVCPNSMVRKWRSEFEVWFPEARVEILDGPRAKKLQAIERVKNGESDVLVANWEALRYHSRLAGYGSVRLQGCKVCDPAETREQRLCAKCPKELNEIGWHTIAADEGHRCKNPKAHQTRALWALRTSATTLRVVATGTWIANNPGDAWAQLHFADPKSFPSKTKFTDRFLLTTFNPFGGMDILGLNPATQQEFFSIIDPHMIRRSKAEVLPQLPKKQYTVLEVEMAPKQAKAYREMVDSMVAELENGDHTVALDPIVQRLRLIQFASAYAEINSDGKVRLAEPSNKIDALMELLEEADGKPLVVFAQSTQLLNLAGTRLEKAGIRHGLITGKQSGIERQMYMDQFQDGKLAAILCQMQAGGSGITLTAADALVFLQNTDSSIDRSQAEDRVHRIGSEQHKSINIIDIRSVGTIEETQEWNLAMKQGRLQELLRDKERMLCLLGTKKPSMS